MAMVHVDDREVRHVLDNGKVECVAWDELEEVSILTTSDGPFLDDVFLGRYTSRNADFVHVFLSGGFMPRP
jgi:hypothetical protein